MKLFLIISLSILALSCGSYPKKNNFKLSNNLGDVANTYFSNPHQDYVYKASIEVYGRHFGGIFIVKKMGDQQHRIVFTTEMGNKLFDFSFDKSNFKVNYVLDELNKKILINILKNDFKVLISEHLPAEETYISNNETIKKTYIDNKIYYYFENPEVYKIIRTSQRKEKVRFLFTEINDNIAQQIDIIHLNIKLKIVLKSLN